MFSQIINTNNFEGDKGEDHGKDHGENHGEDSGEHYQSSEWNIVNYTDEGETQDQGYYEATIWQDDNGEYHIEGEYHRVIYTTNGDIYEQFSDYGLYTQTSYPTHPHSNSNELPKDLGLPKFIKRQRKQQE